MSGFKPLHYGGSITPHGQLGAKPASGVHFKAMRRIENMIRLENAGFTVGQIAAMLTISRNRVSTIMKSAEYLTRRIAITHGIVLDGDAQLATIKAQQKQMLATMLPTALQAIANEIQRPAVTLEERKHQNAVVRDLLDREGTFAKISRTEIKPVDAFEFETLDASSRSILNTIRSVAAPGAQSQHTKETLEANIAFSNCQTLSSVEQQEALALLEEAETTGSVN